MENKNSPTSRIKTGYFYNTLTFNRQDDAALKDCIETTVSELSKLDTSLQKPGILLGKIQSGKTRAFLGVIALVFDNGYDIAVILTKGTKVLTEQTLKRLHQDFGIFEDDSKVQIHDIMFFPKNMVPYELNQKLIIVAKKETNNLKHILNALTDTYPDLKSKKILIVDDEADFASIGFHKEKESGLIEQNKIAKQIDEIRTKVERSNFLQVTATPYSLYLQPDNEDGEDGLFPPKRPAFTVLLPIHKDYVGGDYYFIESQKESSPAAHVYEEVSTEELDVLKAHKKLKRADRRSFKIEEVFSSSATKSLRDSIMNFIVGGCIRRIQHGSFGQKVENYSFVIHTEQSRTSHSWQEDIVKKLNEELINIAKNNKDLFNKLVTDAYENLKSSIELTGLNLPQFDVVLVNASKALIEGMLVVEKVNSDKDVKALLDTKGQLKLRTPLNIFIGGQILDRGITIKNMIGFYYGRNPKRFQQDTVLQHSRMYGARSKEDLAVTRFYTTHGIYEVMRRIHEFDEALRSEIERMIKDGSFESKIYFIRKDSSDRLVPCSPNKIMLSNITTLRPYKPLLPIGFQTDYKCNIVRNINELDQEILGMKEKEMSDYFMIPVEQALTIMDKIYMTFVYDKDDEYKWDINSHKASIEHLSRSSVNASQRGKVWVVVRTNSDIARTKADGRFSDDPAGGSGEVALTVAKRIANDIPALILIRVNGDEKQRWHGVSFWWPVVIPHKNARTTIFASEAIDLP